MDNMALSLPLLLLLQLHLPLDVYPILGLRLLHGKVELIWVALLCLALQVLQAVSVNTTFGIHNSSRYSPLLWPRPAVLP